jgi:Ca2+-binding RTX toxin-like protein
MATSGIVAYGGGGGADRLINHGIILGEVRFAGGEDVFDGRQGYVGGRILGGAGDDTFIIDDGRADILEVAAEGDDKVRSSVSYALTAGQEIEHLVLTGSRNIRATGNELANQLTGNTKANALNGLAGIDTLNGGRGNDKMTGGADKDTFFFAKGGGHDQIVDFDISADLLDLSKWDGVETLARVRAHAHEEHGGLTIEAGQDSLFLKGIEKNDLTTLNFADM